LAFAKLNLRCKLAFTAISQSADYRAFPQSGALYR
jgi:hypothetical protein